METRSDGSFADMLRRSRKSAGLTQEALAELSGVSTRTVSDLERGINRAPRSDTLMMLASALDLPDSDLKEWKKVRKALSVRSVSPVVTAPESGTIQLPVYLTDFVGRGQQVQHVIDLLHRQDIRLLTLTGPGGVGKTRLAIAAVRQSAPAFPDGVWFIDLAPVQESSLVLQTVADAIHIHVRASQTALEALVNGLSGKRALLLIDNVEHVLDAAVDIGRLVQECLEVTILTTSRAPLRVQGEQEFLVLPLDLPDIEQEVRAADLQQSEAVSLFIHRVHEIRPDFAITDKNAAAIAGICRRLDGMPLAIELAAARIRFLSPQVMLDRLENSLALLRGGAVDLPPRQQTLRGTIAWSYDLLPERSQRLFRRLSVFRGGWSLDSAERVSDDQAVIEHLERLVEHSLVRVYEQQGGEPRYTMLETIREFGLERLVEHGEQDQAYGALGDYLIDLAEDAISWWRTFEHQHWYGQLETELDNLRAALGWFIERDPVFACRLGGALWRFWAARGNVREGRVWLETSLERAPDLTPAVRARVLEGIGTCAYMMSDYNVVRTSLEEALLLWESIGDRKGIAWAHHGFARIALGSGDYQGAEQRCNMSLAISREIRDLLGIADMLNVLGVVASAKEEDARAQKLYEESLALRQEVGDYFGVQQSLSNIGYVAMRDGDYPRARVLIEESLAIGQKYHFHRQVEAMDHLQLGILAILEGEYARATDHVARSIRQHHWQGTSLWVAKCLMAFAEIAIATGQQDRAVTLAGVIDLLVEERHLHIPQSERARFDSLLAGVKNTLDTESWAAAWARGRAMSLNEAVEFALAGAGQTSAQDLG